MPTSTTTQKKIQRPRRGSLLKHSKKALTSILPWFSVLSDIVASLRAFAIQSGISASGILLHGSAPLECGSSGGEGKLPNWDDSPNDERVRVLVDVARLAIPRDGLRDEGEGGTVCWLLKVVSVSDERGAGPLAARRWLKAGRAAQRRVFSVPSGAEALSG